MKAKGMKKRVTKIARGKRAKSTVFRGGREKTSGGLKKSDLIKNKFGKVVSKKASARRKVAYKGSKLEKWGKANQQARKALGLKGFVAIGGKTAGGKALYAKAKSLLA